MSKVLVDEIPTWMQETLISEYDEDFIKILDFFQFHSPVKGLSARCVTIQEYGWHSPWKKPFWLNKQLKQMSSNYELLFSASDQSCMTENLEKAELKENFPSDLDRERICVVDNKKNQFLSVFYHIRDSFAHGRFYVHDCNENKVFVMEDVGTKKYGDKKPLTARMIIRKETLVKWIDLIKGGEKEYGIDFDKGHNT